MSEISIIVPIYNMAKLMRKCIDSLLAQTFTDFELLLIDDGSQDGSPEICDEYANQDVRVRAFHKPNGGLSDARNYGLERAQGKYTIFADPDDWVDASGLDKLYLTAKRTNADITICDLYREDEYSRHYVKQQPSSLEHDVVLKELFEHIGGFTVNKLIRRELYDKYNISYPKGIYGCEDQYTIACLLKHNIKIAYIPVAFYHYMYNPNSLTRHYDEKTYMMDVHILKMFEALLQGTSAFDVGRKNKRDAIFSRAFWNGKNFYTSKEFKRRFTDYQSEIDSLKESRLIKWMMKFACMGRYKLSITIVFFLFKLKQCIKKLRYFIVKSK